MSKLKHERLKSRGLVGRIKIRIKRAWRGWKVGDVIQPPAALREQLLRQRDPLGQKIAEVVDDKKPTEQQDDRRADTSSTASSSKPADKGIASLLGGGKSKKNGGSKAKK